MFTPSMLKKTILTACAVIPLMTTSALAEQSPYTKANGSWISLSGKVTDVKPESFTLDYGSNTVTVEMDDWDWYDESRAVLKGDKVTVYGMVDDDIYETAKIEASSVYVESLGTYFYASAADEEGPALTNYWLTSPVVYVGDVTLNGTVKSVDGRSFTIDTGAREMRVDTSSMKYNPVDDKGFQKIEKGDVVVVTGDMKFNTFKNRELAAETIITLDESDQRMNNRNKNKDGKTASR